MKDKFKDFCVWFMIAIISYFICIWLYMFIKDYFHWDILGLVVAAGYIHHSLYTEYKK